MIKRVEGNYSPHSDMTVGVYRDRKFTPYSSDKSLRASIDSGADPEVINLAKKGRAIHGSYKDGNFRPAEIRGRRGYVDHINTPDGAYGFNHEGELVGRGGEVVGAIDESGKVLSKEEYRENVRKDIKTAIKDWRSQREPSLTETYEALAKVEGELYRDIRDIAKKVGIGEEEVRKYARELSHYNKDVSERVEAEDRGKRGRGGLERTLNSILAIAGFGAGIFFLSSNITGNAIADATTKTTSFLGAGLVIVGLVAGFFWLKNRK